MEYVDGGTLERFCTPEHLLPVDKAVEIVFKCTRALEFAHRMGITHRDIKPANILYAGETDVKITDFGAALIASGESTQISAIGSPAYMSPQQVKEHPLDHRTDIYSHGRGDVPPARRPPAVPGLEQLQPDLPDHQRRAAAALLLPARDPAGAGRHRAPRDGEGPRAALPEWEEFSLDLAQVFRGEAVDATRRPASAASPIRTSSRRCASCRSSRSSPTPSYGRWRASRPGARPRRARC